MKAQFVTDLGSFTVTLDLQRAPITAGYFKALIAGGGLNGTSFFRIVASDNAEIRTDHPIEVVQGGRRHTDTQPLDPIAHEPTSVTGLHHRQWTVSTARLDPGETFGSFFICMRNEPALDEGGGRHPDGLGFAAFGHVSEGTSTVEEIFQRRGDLETLSNEDAVQLRSCSLIGAS
ncbi:MAG: peptidylprolyl isomerase [Pseudomonadota bacterium]